MRHHHGTPAQAVRNLRSSRLPWPRLVRVLARNLARRLGPPPQDCCGHPGEPGC